VAALNSRVPFMHFMDGFRTSHEINKITLVSDDQLRDLLPWDKIEEHRQRGMSPMHPTYVSPRVNRYFFVGPICCSNLIASLFSITRTV